MFCMNCGTQLPDGAKFCMNCGTKMGDAPAPAPAPAVPAVQEERSPEAVQGLAEQPVRFTYEDFCGLLRTSLRITVKTIACINGTVFVLEACAISNKCDNSGEEELKKLVREFIPWLADYDTTEMKRDLLLPAWKSLGEYAIGLYNIDIIDLLEEHGSALGEYALSSDNAAQLGQMLYDRNIPNVQLEYSSVFSELAHFAARKTAYLELIEDKYDWAGLAKNFAGGALVGLNPIIGVPVFVANMFGMSKKNKAENAMREELGMHITRLAEHINALDQAILQVHQDIEREMLSPLAGMLDKKRAVISGILGPADTAKYYSALTEAVLKPYEDNADLFEMLERHADELPAAVAASLGTIRAQHRKGRNSGGKKGRN